MRALELKNGQVELRTDFPVPEPPAGEVRIRVIQAGICETDLQLVQGYMGFEGVLGHEFVGIAETGQFQGERVVGEINCYCGTCDFCKIGNGNHCPNRSVLGILNRNGAFADYVTLPERNLHRVPDSLSTESAVFTEPLAAALRIPEQLMIRPGHRVLVLGDGRLGNLSAQVIAGLGCEVIVIGKHLEKLQRLDQLGIETCLRVAAQPDRSADIVVDCTGSSSGFADALKWVKPLGTVVLKTTVAGDSPVFLAPIVIDEVTVLGSRCGPFARALEVLCEGTVDVKALIDSVYSFDDSVTAIEAARDSNVLKILLDFERSI